MDLLVYLSNTMGTHNKHYFIGVHKEGRRYELHRAWGAIGRTPTAESPVGFATFEEAVKEAEKVIKSKTKGGYTLHVGCVPSHVPAGSFPVWWPGRASGTPERSLNPGGKGQQTGRSRTAPKKEPKIRMKRPGAEWAF